MKYLSSFWLENMKTFIVTLFLVTVGFNNFIDAGFTLDLEERRLQAGLPPIREFKYNPRKHSYLNSLERSSGKNYIYGFDPKVNTLLIRRGEKLFGWLNEKREIRPFNKLGILTMYDLDEKKFVETNEQELKIFGCWQKLDKVHPSDEEYFRSRSKSPSRPSSSGLFEAGDYALGSQERILQAALPPIREFKYNPKRHRYLNTLERLISGNLVLGFNPNDTTILVRRAQRLFGWLDENRVIQPFYKLRIATMYDLDEKKPLPSTIQQLKIFGCWDGLYPVDHWNEEYFRSRSLSPSRPVQSAGSSS